MIKSKFKIALILLDDFKTSNDKDFADLGKQLIESSISKFQKNQLDNYQIEFTKFNYILNQSELPNLNEFQLIYLTGSRKDSYVNNQFNILLIDFLKTAILKSENLKILGICYGHQIISRSLDLITLPNEKGWEIGNTLVEISNDEILSSRNSKIPNNFIISEMHRDIVQINKQDGKYLKDLGINSFGKTPICSVQGLYKLGKLLTFQGHPEFSSELTNEMVDNKFKSGLISQEILNDVKIRNNNLHEDGNDLNGNLKLQKWIADFIFE